MKTAFSLDELSIVLVILGLLTGGILAGQSLIRASELRSIPLQYAQFVTATRSFQSKYMQLPGDMNNATAFWGDQATGTEACPNPAVADGTPGTCNGNGGGTITSTEKFRYWQQLTLAGLLEGSYSGITGPINSSDHVAGVNAPAGRLSNSVWSALYRSSTVGNGNMFDGIYNHTLTFGAKDTSSGWPDGSILRPEEAWNIYTKIDDGKPARGKLIIHNYTTCTDAVDNTSLDANYKLDITDIACGFRFVQAF